eukprot:3007856-Amphidinium_carterae.1
MPVSEKEARAVGVAKGGSPARFWSRQKFGSPFQGACVFRSITAKVATIGSGPQWICRITACPLQNLGGSSQGTPNGLRSFTSKAVVEGSGPQLICRITGRPGQKWGGTEDYFVVRQSPSSKCPAPAWPLRQCPLERSLPRLLRQARLGTFL